MKKRDSKKARKTLIGGLIDEIKNDTEDKSKLIYQEI